MTTSQKILAGRYRLHETLGQGGMGRVWRATDELLHRQVAVKEVVLPIGLTADEVRETGARASREARAAARLSHPNVVIVYDIVVTDTVPWIVMEYLPSRSLDQKIVQDGPMRPVVAARVGLYVLAAMRAAHQVGVLHRDIKPSNVLLTDSGRVVLTDFGLATIVGDPAVTRTGTIFGSPSYMAPERARDAEANEASDLWSLGATLYFAVEGRAPYQRGSALATVAALASEDPDSATRAGALQPVLDGLLRRDPASRLVADQLEDLLHDIVESAAAAAPKKAVAPKQRAAEPAVTKVMPVVGKAPEPAPKAAGRAALPPTAVLPAVVDQRVPAPRAAPSSAPPKDAAGGAASPAAQGSASPSSAASEAAPSSAAPSGAAPSSAAAKDAPSSVANDTPTKAIPPKSAPAKAAPAKTAPVKAVPVKAVPAEAGSAKAEPAAAAPSRPLSGSTAGSGRAGIPAPRQALTEVLGDPGERRIVSPGNRRQALIVAAVSLVLVAAGAGWALTRGEDPAGQAVNTPVVLSPSAPASSAPAPSAAASSPVPSPSPSLLPSPAADTLPAGWHVYTDGTGFSVAVPESWRVTREGTMVYFREVGGPRVLGIDQTDKPKSDPVADWTNQESRRVAGGDFANYQRVRLEKVDYFLNAADWEFTYNSGSGSRMHVNNRGFVTSPTRAYGMWWSTLDSRWAEHLPDLQLIQHTFTPAG